MASDITLVRADPGDPRVVLNIGVQDGHAEDQFHRPPQPQYRAPPPPPPQPPVPAPPPPPPQPRAEELGDFANPVKVTHDEFDDGGDDHDDDDNQYEDDGGGTGFPGHDFDQDQDQQPVYYRDPPVDPLPPFTTIEDERADLMYKLSRAARTSTFHVKTFPYNADVRELRAEVGRIKAEQDVTASIAFQRHMLMTICSGLEMANRKFDMMDLSLDGWSESVIEDIGKYDPIFEKLHAKHASRMNVPPEVQLILMVGGSALTWHLTHTLMRRAEPPAPSKKKKSKKRVKKKRRRQDSDDDDSDTDDLDKTVAERFARVAKKTQPARKEMRGPGFDIGAMLPSMLPPMTTFPSDAFQPPQLTRPLPVPQPQQLPTRLPQQPALPRIVEESLSPDDMSERLSDIASEDLPMVPDDLDQAFSADMDQRVIDIPDPGAPKKRGRKKTESTKKVVVI